MSDPEQIGAATPVEAPVSEAVPVQPEPVEAESTSTETPPAEPKTYTSWREALADADPEELLKDDRIAGRIGQVADKRAREIAAQQKRDDDAKAQVAADRAEEDRLRTLRQTNVEAYAHEMERKDATREAIQEEARRQAALAADVTGELANYVRSNYPKEVVESLAGKTYEGTYAQGVAAYYADLDKLNRDHLRAQWEKDELPAMRKRVLTELNGGEVPIDASTGGERTGKKFNSNMEASQALYDGKITVQEYTRQARQNGWR